MSDTTVRWPIRWISAQKSHVGIIRGVNEDSILSLPEVQLWAVADGMGGYEAGKVASNKVVEALEGLSSKPNLAEFVDHVEASLIKANKHILQYADRMLDGRTLGSTVVTLIIQHRVGICLWAGDSRLYRLRGNQLSQLSKDHSQVEWLMQQGEITAEEALTHPDLNIITRAVGASQVLYLDINVFSVELGDIFLLCSDGLYNALPIEDVVEIIAALSITEAVNTLMQQALKNGARDNVSIVLVSGESCSST